MVRMICLPALVFHGIPVANLFCYPFLLGKEMDNLRLTVDHWAAMSDKT